MLNGERGCFSGHVHSLNQGLSNEMRMLWASYLNRDDIYCVLDTSSSDSRVIHRRLNVRILQPDFSLTSDEQMPGLLLPSSQGRRRDCCSFTGALHALNHILLYSSRIYRDRGQVQGYQHGSIYLLR